MDRTIETDDTDFLPIVRQVQANILLSTYLATAAFNTFIAISAALVANHLHHTPVTILLWLAGVLGILALRTAITFVMSRRGLAETRPVLVLTVMSAGSFLSGLSWCVLPFILPHFDGSGFDSSLLLIMAGISGGAVIRGMVYYRMSLAFALPIQLTIVITLLATGGLAAYVLATNILALMSILVRSSRVAENTFVDNELAALRATAYAASLAQANETAALATQRLERVANYDSVTDLRNRQNFNSVLNETIAAARDEKNEVALLLIDLDHFKQINDTQGHSSGDTVLTEIARRLTIAVGDRGMIARIGGDEFAVVFKGAFASVDARATADHILQMGAKPVAVGEGSMIVSASIGLAAFPHDADNSDDLLSCADMALYGAKAAGRRCMKAFDPAMKADAERRRAIEQDLPAAIHANEIEVWFQPQVALDTGEVVGVEALLRWYHPRFGAIPPPEVVRAAQALHIADRLTASVANAACRLITQLPTLGLPNATVAVNVSPLEFALYSVSDMLEAIGRSHGINPGLLEVEITEEATLDTEVAGEQLKRMENAGFKLAVDDFGMGHSSLAYLVSLKVDRLKIDRSFVQGVTESRFNQALITALVGLGRGLSFEIVVEGVENQKDADTLKGLGIRIAQGYHFARPMSAAALSSWLSAR